MFRSFLWSLVLISLTPTLAATVTANFVTASSIPVIEPYYNATGNDVALSLGFTPPAGTNLTIVKNTGLALIAGQFINLAHGQTVNLSYSGNTYKFVANYYGGSGNDLVLHWVSNELTAWGANFDGQLGDGTNLVKSALPVRVTHSGVLANKSIVAISAGDEHSVALCSDGKLASWGANLSGQLGDGTNFKSGLPVLVTETGVLAGKTITAISAGGSHSLALCSDGSMAAWGENSSGQLGNNSTTDSSVPVLVTQSGVLAGKVIMAISAGATHSFALCWDGTLVAWGKNSSGQLGNNSTTNSSVPVLVTQNGVLAGKTITAISAGDSLSLVLCSDGTLASWGANAYGQLGNNSTTNRSVPVLVDQNDVLAGKTINVISAGHSHSLALCSDGTLAAWGKNSSGQLGNNSFTDSSVPMLVSQSGVLTGKNIVDISAGNNSSLARCSDGALAAWGENSSGQLGNNSAMPSSVPVLVTQSGVLSSKVISAISAGGTHNLALSSDGTLASWGANSDGQLGNHNGLPALVTQSGVLAGKTIIAISAGGDYNLALCSDGSLAAWGKNDYGQLGNDSSTASSVPVGVTQSGVLAGKTIIAISAGREDSLALCSDGTLATWGRNGGGLPILVTQNGVLAGKKIIAISAGGAHSLALCSDGTLVAWGDNTIGQLGNNYDSYPGSSVPVLVTQSGVLSDKTIIAIAAGNSHSLALCSDGTLAVWGNKDGQWGVNSTTNTGVPVLVNQSGVMAGKTITAISAGGFHNLALCSDGTLAAWGNNSYGQLGNDSTTNSAEPVGVTQSGYLASRTAIAISAGLSHSLALCSDGKLVAWGNNSSGQLGNNSKTASSAPVPVSQSGVIAGKTVVAISAGNSHCIVLAASQHNCELSGLATSAGTLGPVFSSATTTYSTSVSNATASLKVSPTATNPSASVKVNGAAVLFAFTSPSIPLSVGPNTITVLVTAQDGSTTKTYTILVIRAASSVATLKGLSIKSIVMSPKFKSTTTAYTVSVGKATTSIKITPTATHYDATIKVNGTTIKSGSLSKAIPLKIGKNTIKIVVTAQDSTAKTYKIVITRSSAAASSPRSVAIIPSAKSAAANARAPEIARTMKVVSHGRAYLQVTIRKGDPAVSHVVEVSSNLIDWFSGDRNTTVLVDDHTMLCVRDNTPITPRSKRFIRVRTIRR